MIQYDDSQVLDTALQFEKCSKCNYMRLNTDSQHSQTFTGTIIHLIIYFQTLNKAGLLLLTGGLCPHA